MKRRENFYSRWKWFGFLILALVCMLFMLAEIINHRFWLSDFEVYYKAAGRILMGHNLYRVWGDDFYVFKYSPTSAMLFIPFSFFSFGAGKVIYWMFLTLLIILGFFLGVKITGEDLLKDGKKLNTIILFASLILALHFLRELHLGQVNYLLLFIYILALYSYTRGRSVLFSLLLALSLFIKPFALILIPWLLLRKRYREILLFSGFTMLFALLPFLFYSSFASGCRQYALWFEELRIELALKQDLLAPANHTLFSVLARYTPVRFLSLQGSVRTIYELFVLGLMALFVLAYMRKGGKITGSVAMKQMVWEFSLLIALIPLLAFTDENAFLYMQMVILLLLVNFGQLNSFQKGLAAAGFLFIGGNFGEALGPELSGFINDISLISLGAMIVLGLLYAIKGKEVPTSTS